MEIFATVAFVLVAFSVIWAELKGRWLLASHFVLVNAALLLLDRAWWSTLVWLGLWMTLLVTIIRRTDPTPRR